MNNQDKGLKRDTIDKFYTKEVVVENCVNLIKSNIDINSNDLIIEPSAGAGAFIKYIKKLSNEDLPTHSFTMNNIEYDVPCVFQIWIKKSFNREKKEKEIPNGFNFVKKNEQPDISFRRVGVYAGKVDTNIEDKSEQSHYFIKFTKQVDVSSLHNIEFDKDNTVGPRSISKPELIEKFNEIL